LLGFNDDACHVGLFHKPKVYFLCRGLHAIAIENDNWERGQPKFTAKCAMEVKNEAENMIDVNQRRALDG